MTRDDLGAIFVKDGRDDDLAGFSVDRFQRTLEESIAPAIGMAAIADPVEIGIEGAARPLMQQGLPDRRLAATPQEDIEFLAGQRGPQARDELEPACPAANHDDLDLLRVPHGVHATTLQNRRYN